jgi:hypothetical protein
LTDIVRDMYFVLHKESRQTSSCKQREVTGRFEERLEAIFQNQLSFSLYPELTGEDIRV